MLTACRGLLVFSVIALVSGLALHVQAQQINAQQFHIQQLHKERVEVSAFANGGFDKFSEKSFVGNTRYQLLSLDGRPVLKASTKAAASVLYREMKIDLRKTPFLHWQWRVDNIYNIENQMIKQGDDYPARVYVVVKDGPFPWQTKALNYVWSNKKEPQPYWENPFTSSAIMIPVRAGAEGLGQWQQQTVNVADDFYRIFGRRIKRADGVAIMTDADNHGASAVAYYADIFFSNSAD